MRENDNGKIEEAQRLYKDGNFPQALSIIGDLKRSIYANINKCIILDRMGWDQELALELSNIMGDPEINQCNDYEIWDCLAFLNYKIQKFEEAILCMDKILEAKIPLELEIQTLIRKSYCLEAQYKFEEAIEILEKVIKCNPSTLHPFKSDIFHGLGHFYNERGNLKKTISDIRTAEQYMKKAADLDPKYYPCLGTIHSENKKYQKALSVFNDALEINEIKNNDHIYNEILFYKADALGWLGEYSEADKSFDKFKEYCEKYGSRDGKVHCLVSKIETTLRGKSIFDVTEDELSSWLELLNGNKPSLYANKAIHEEWKKLKYLLDGIYKLKCFFNVNNYTVNNYTVNISDISRCFNKAVEIMGSNVSLLTLTDKPSETKSLKEYNSLKIISENPSNFEIELLAKDDVWIVLLFESCPGRYIAWIAEKAKEKTIILYFNETVESQIPPEIKTKTFVLNDIDEAVSIAYTLSLYDFLRKDLIKPFFLFGMAPTTQAPSFSSQTGWVDELIMEK